MKAYTQLIPEERYQIYALRQADHNEGEIAVMIGRHGSIISRDLDLN